MMLVSTEWLADHLEDPAIAIVDMRWREDGSGRRLFEQGHIPGAVFIDWATDLVDPEDRFAFMMAPPSRFASLMERHGIGDRTIVVAYADELGSGPFRLWLGSRQYGHDNVRVLDGGLAKWVAEDRPLSTQIRHPTPRGGPAGRAIRSSRRRTRSPPPVSTPASSFSIRGRPSSSAASRSGSRRGRSMPTPTGSPGPPGATCGRAGSRGP